MIDKSLIGTVRICELCNQEYTPKQNNQKYCSPTCYKNYVRRSFLQSNPTLTNIASGTVGTIHELQVCVDLLTRGYEVFKSVSSQCSCDLAFIANKQLFRVEVKTAYRTPNNRLNFPCSGTKKDRYDILALVCNDGTITYQPSLPEIQKKGM